MERHLEPVADELRELHGHQRAHCLAAENAKNLSGQLVGPVRARAGHVDARTIERAG